MSNFNPHSILGLVFSTNEPDTAKTHILKSIDAFKEVAPICTFLINFQDPWTIKECSEALEIIESFGFEVLYVHNGKYPVAGKGLVPINKIRNDTAMQLPDAKYYALIDDDMTFRYGTDKVPKTAGHQYVDAIHYLINHQNCGVLMMGGQLIRYPAVNHIGPTALANSYLTNRGYILKAMNPDDGSFLPKDAVDLLGSDEDRVLAAYRLYSGLYPARMSNGRTSHYDKTCVPGYEMYEWNTKQILDENNHGFIRSHYKHDFDGSSHNTDLVDHNHYFEVGGLDVYNPDVVKENTVDYNGSNVEDEIREIINYYSGGNI